MMGSKAYESPLISNVRMRALYRALVEVRLLGQRAVKGRSADQAFPRNLEACWVAAAMDLKPGDLRSLPHGGWLVEHTIRAGLRDKAQAASKAEMTRSLRALASSAPGTYTGFERLLSATGMATALRSAGRQEVVLVFVACDELSTSEWKRALTVALPGELPLILVATPGALQKAPPDFASIVRRMGVKTLPVIPVDAGDPLALYRVAQETLVRARADGGVALIECIACGVDPVQMLGSQLIRKQICTERWVAAVEPSFRTTLASL